MADTELETFLKGVIKDYEDYYQGANVYGYSNLGWIPRVSVAKNLYNDLLASRAYPAHSTVTTIYFDGAHISEDDTLNSNEILTYKKYLYQGAVSLTERIHSCEYNKQRYTGFTHVYDFCTVCNKKFPIDLYNKEKK